LLLLGLVAELPRYDYEIDQVVEQRGMREWTGANHARLVTA
jgi:DNA-binding PadR family transcriptional regulator